MELETRKLQRLAVDALEDVKGKDIVVYNTTKLTDLFERVILCTGFSTTQVRALAQKVERMARDAGFPSPKTEGLDAGQWALVDLGPVVVHVMLPQVRLRYNMEELWGGKRVNVKISPECALPRTGVRS